MGSIDALINRQLLQWEAQQKALREKDSIRKPSAAIVTVSRQRGSRGSYFASRLAEKLHYQLVHREIIDTICITSGYRKRVIASIDDRFRSSLALLAESLFTGQTVDHSDYNRHLFQIILSMSRLGGVVLIGRGGNFILGPERGFHIRFIAPKQKRIANLVEYEQISSEEAEDTIERSDKERSAFVRKLFDADINDPEQYDLVLNVDYMDVEELVDVAVTAISGKFDKLAHLPD